MCAERGVGRDGRGTQGNSFVHTRQALVDTEIANPGYNFRVLQLLAILAKWLGRARVTAPTPLENTHVYAGHSQANMLSQEEAVIVTFMTVNLPLGARSIDIWLLDWSEVSFVLDGAVTGAGQGAHTHTPRRNR